MKLSKVTYSALANLGNYENQRIELEADIENESDYEPTLNKLKELVHKELNNLDSYYRRVDELSNLELQIKKAERKLAEVNKEWEGVRSFLIAQGIKEDVPSIPLSSIMNMLPPAEAAKKSSEESDCTLI